MEIFSHINKLSCDEVLFVYIICVGCLDFAWLSSYN